MRKDIAAFARVMLTAAVLASLAPLSVMAQQGALGQGGQGQAAAPKPGPIRRTADGKPDLSGLYGADAGGANYGLERHDKDFLTPGTRGVVVDPADGKLPYLPWAKAERVSRELPEHGYDDPTAHCF